MDVLTKKEEDQIGSLQKKPMSFDPALFSFERRLGLVPVVTVNNISGKRAWVILSPAPITGVVSFGIDNVANVAFSTQGEYKCQHLALPDKTSKEYDLDTSQIYYSVFFDCEGVWKTPFKNRKINTRKFNINLLERHVEQAVDAASVPT